MVYSTRVVALSREQAQQFESPDPYVVISLTDTDAQHPDIPASSAFMDRLLLQFDDVCPPEADDFQDPLLCAMQAADAQRIAHFVLRWWGEVATIVVHCHAGLSRSTAVAAAIRRHHRQDDRDLFEEPRSPNPHCLRLVAQALLNAAPASHKGRDF